MNRGMAAECSKRIRKVATRRLTSTYCLRSRRDSTAIALATNVIQAQKQLRLAMAALMTATCTLSVAFIFFQNKAIRTYQIFEQIYLSGSFWFPTIFDYTETTCPKDSIVIGYFGQSNSANSVFPRFRGEIPSNLYQLDRETGRCYRYKEPLLSADGLGGNTITSFATELARGVKGPILIVAFGKGGSSAFDWSHGYLADRHAAVLDIMVRKKLKPHVFFWHQGENGTGSQTDIHLEDSIKYKNEQEEKTYENLLIRIIDKTRKIFPESYFGIALVSLCKGQYSESIRKAQRNVVSTNIRNFISADSDKKISPSYRYDGCHISQEGAKILDREYYNSFSKYVRQNSEKIQ